MADTANGYKETMPEIGRMRRYMPPDASRNEDGTRKAVWKEVTKKPGELCHIGCLSCCDRVHAPMSPNCKACVRTEVLKCLGRVTTESLSDYMQLCRMNMVDTPLLEKPW